MRFEPAIPPELPHLDNFLKNIGKLKTALTARVKKKKT